ncbi:MAG: aminotransferase class I/II-fold pyridoxal phosphate-dependent enzyme [Pirellulales bacterium]|nr:aminotransferase class I/II-fold pyridoxal phosphate-dependent enzyme [Pirellulales bacterium]
MPTTPIAPPLYPSVVYRCDSPTQAAGLLNREAAGYVYSRDGHPNGDQLAAICCQHHAVQEGIACGSGMAALSTLLLGTLSSGDHLIASNLLYGQTTNLLRNELPKLGITSTEVDPCDIQAVEAAFANGAKGLLVETISNPMLRVIDLAKLAEIAHGSDAWLAVDNTFASPSVCRPVEHGADFILESITKMMNGHSDVLLGFVGGNVDSLERLRKASITWGFTAAPFDCWLATRGIGTLDLRVERACANAMTIAQTLQADGRVNEVSYPGLPQHPDHELCRRQFHMGRFGHMLSFTLPGGWDAASKFIAAARCIPFSPSLGDLETTLSHPASTSHRKLSQEERLGYGIDDGTLRLSIGIEPVERIVDALEEGLTGLR